MSFRLCHSDIAVSRSVIKTHRIMFVIIPVEVSNFLLLRKSHQAKLLILAKHSELSLFQIKPA